MPYSNHEAAPKLADLWSLKRRTALVVGGWAGRKNWHELEGAAALRCSGAGSSSTGQNSCVDGGLGGMVVPRKKGGGA